jgi:hypothetical protein
MRPTWAQDTQVPVHATLQQTPSAQKLEAHSAPLAHTAPFSFRPQLPATHFVPAQSASDPHVAKHAFAAALHWNGVQTVVGPALQRPLPSQTLAPTTAAPSHAPAWQTVPAAYLWQPPVPSHVPSSPHEETSLIEQSLGARGAPPSGTVEHVPGAPGALHVWQGSAQLELQQSPSTQKPL